MKNGKYVLVVDFGEKFGGAERRLIRIYNYLAKSKNIELIVRGTDKFDFRKNAKKGDVPYDNFRKVHCYGIGYINNIKCIANIVFSRYLTVHFLDFSNFNWALSLTCKIFRIKSIATVADYNYVMGKFREFDIKRVKQLYSFSNCIDLLYPNGETYIKEISGNKNVFITPGTFTDLDIFVPKEKKKIILYAAARLTKQKNAVMLISAALKISDFIRKKGYQIWILGHGYCEEELKKLVSQNNVGDFICFKGYMKTSDIMPYAKVFTSLQWGNNYPSQSLAEANACGCYVIATNVGDTAKMLLEGCSELVEDENGMARALETYMNLDDHIQDNYVTKIREFAEPRFNINESVKYFNNLLGNRNR